MFNEDDYKILIANALYQKDIIDDDIYLKCSKPHISSLPGDMRSNDVEMLENRRNAILDKINEDEDRIKKYEKAEEDINNDLKELQKSFPPLKEEYQSVKDSIDILQDFNEDYFNQSQKEYENLKKNLKKNQISDATATGFSDIMKSIDDDFKELESSFSGNSERDMFDLDYIRNYNRMPPSNHRKYENLINDLDNLYNILYRDENSDASYLQNISDTQGNISLLREGYDNLLDISKDYFKAEQNLRFYHEEQDMLNDRRSQYSDIQYNLRNRVNDYKNELKKVDEKLNS